jgi:hypothetical protein
MPVSTVGYPSAFTAAAIIRGVWTGFLSLLTDHCEFDILQSSPGW